MCVNKDEADAVTSRERVAEFISGVMQAEANALLGHSDVDVIKYEFIVFDDCDADHFFSQFCVLKNLTSGHGFAI